MIALKHLGTYLICCLFVGITYYTGLILIDGYHGYIVNMYFLCSVITAIFAFFPYLILIFILKSVLKTRNWIFYGVSGVICASLSLIIALGVSLSSHVAVRLFLPLAMLGFFAALIYNYLEKKIICNKKYVTDNRGELN